MTTKDLDGNNEGILHEIIVNHAVEDLEGTIITGRGKERLVPMVGDRSDSLLMISKGLVRLGGEVHIEPTSSPVICTDEDIITLRMDIHAGNPSYTRLKGLDELLLLQVVHAYITLGLGGYEEGKGRKNKVNGNGRKITG